MERLWVSLCLSISLDFVPWKRTALIIKNSRIKTTYKRNWNSDVKWTHFKRRNKQNPQILSAKTWLNFELFFKILEDLVFIYSKMYLRVVIRKSTEPIFQVLLNLFYKTQCMPTRKLFLIQNIISIWKQPIHICISSFL